jgi:hypothetical protein
MTASFSPTCTVVPSPTRIARKTPVTGDGTSVSTLSVLTSNSDSSFSTRSPTFFRQATTVPSFTVSPSCGMTTSISRHSS